jgi:hypothetical protein
MKDKIDVLLTPQIRQQANRGRHYAHGIMRVQIRLVNCESIDADQTLTERLADLRSQSDDR